MYHLLTDLFYKLGVYRYAKKFLRRPYLNMLSFLFRLSAKSAIKKFASIMDKNHYLYWLEFGTLLGAVREQRLISHDADIDVPCTYKTGISIWKKFYANMDSD